jgi:hypothetical protein
VSVIPTNVCKQLFFASRYFKFLNASPEYKEKRRKGEKEKLNMLSSGTILRERYSVVKLLGHGGMGEVYLAEDMQLKRKVAVKKVLYSSEEILFKAAEKEAMVLARLQHPNLPKVLEYFSEDQTQFIVMEYIAGRDLGEILQNNYSPLPLEQVLSWADTLLQILEYLHNQTPPVVHRDIKPQNIKISDEGRLFLLDFGLVKDTPARVSGGSLPPTVSGYSLNYAPLEQVNGDPTSVQTDVYGLCATLYHLLTNVKPADALNRATKKIENKPDSLRPAHELNPEIPPDVSRILEHGLKLNSGERVGSIASLRGLFNDVETDYERTHVKIRGNRAPQEINIEPVPEPADTDAKWKWLVAAAAAVLVLTVASFGGYKLYQNRQAGQAAQKIFDDAQIIERTEGFLSKNACVKYKEIQTDFLDSSKSGDVMRKSNDCAIINSLFDQAEKTEKEKGLIFETISGYKEIAEKFPGSAIAKQIEKKIGQFEAFKQATLKAWNEKQDIDNSTITAGALSQQVDEILSRYSKIALENVDTILVEHIKNSIVILKDGKSLAVDLEKEAGTLTEAKKKEVEKYCYESLLNTQDCINSWWSNNGSEFQTNVKETAGTKFQDRIAAFEEKRKGIVEKNKTISAQLNEKYKTEFVNRAT